MGIVEVLGSIASRRPRVVSAKDSTYDTWSVVLRNPAVLQAAPYTITGTDHLPAVVRAAAAPWTPREQSDVTAAPALQPSLPADLRVKRGSARRGRVWLLRLVDDLCRDCCFAIGRYATVTLLCRTMGLCFGYLDNDVQVPNQGGFMRKHSYVRVAALGGAMTLAALTIGAAAPAQADTTAATGTRVIDQTSTAMPVDHAAMSALKARLDVSPSSTSPRVASAAPNSIKSSEEVPLPAGVSLEPGQTVQVNYADGTAIHTAISAACTSSSTAEKPYKESGYAWSYHSHHLSAGCSGSTSVNGLLETPGLLGWNAQDFETVTVTPNSTLYWATDKKCKGTSSTRWHGLNSIGSSVTAQSAEVKLACSV